MTAAEREAIVTAALRRAVLWHTDKAHTAILKVNGHSVASCALSRAQACADAIEALMLVPDEEVKS